MNVSGATQQYNLDTKNELFLNNADNFSEIIYMDCLNSVNTDNSNAKTGHSSKTNVLT